MSTFSIHAQMAHTPSLTIGDKAPRLRVKSWLKGIPVERFEKGKIYVVEFWATWCGPCIASMPHLSALANQYKGKITVIGVDVFEKKATSPAKVKGFVDSMGSKMDYLVAKEDKDYMEKDWMEASAEEGIPHAYVVDEEGKIAWIGHPKDLDAVLAPMVNHTFDSKEALVKRNEQKRLEELDRAAMNTLNLIAGTPNKEDSILIAIHAIVQKEPKLKYAPIIASFTFASLLKTDPHKAYAYGKELLATPSYTDDPSYYSIFGVIDSYWYAGKFNLPKEIYALAAEACQAEIDRYPLPRHSHFFYSKLADWYYRAGNKERAKEAAQIAIEQLKTLKNFKQTDLAAYESKLEQYKNM